MRGLVGMFAGSALLTLVSAGKRGKIGDPE
jgi:hypothetical protein